MKDDSHPEISKLRTKHNKLLLYNAGLPNFPRNFTRDSIISGILLKDAQILKNQLEFCAIKQGKTINPKTGEEKGKIHHEFPGFIKRNLSTLYNACDTTALFIIGHSEYFNITNDSELIKKHKKNLLNAGEYILRHTETGKFLENPKFSKALRYSLQVTYWKDSFLLKRQEKDPCYPIIYPLAHVQNMKALNLAGNFLNSKKMKKRAELMRDKLPGLLDPVTRGFYLGIDQCGYISGISSDNLHSMFYLEKGDLPQKILENFVEISKSLETKIGYRTLEPKFQKDIEAYHSSSVWPFEQAIIHLGAKKWNLKRPQKISSLIMKKLKLNFPEVFYVKKHKFKPGGADIQLWTYAAKKYFERLD